MDTIYILYSPRMQGWFTRSSNYSSDMNEAKTYTKGEALKMCHKHKTQGGYSLLPVRQEDMEAI